MAFGHSLHIDLYGIDPVFCDDLNGCYKLLDELTIFLNMTKQSPPFIFHSPDTFPDKAGISGWVPLIESGISIHTLTPKLFVTLDIYTCGKLDVEETLAYLCERLKPAKYEYHYLIRGLEYGD